MRILLIAKGFPPIGGGLESYSEQVALAYAGMGHDVTVLTARHNRQSTEILDRRVALIDVGTGTQFTVFLRMLRNVWRWRRDQFDVVHATSWRVAVPYLLRGFRSRLVITVHGREVLEVPAVLRPLMKVVLRRAESLPVVSDPIRVELCKGVSGLSTASFVNWNGTTFPRKRLSRDPDQSGVQVLTVCRLVERKNVEGALVAFALAVERGMNLRYVIAGTGPGLEALRRKVEGLGLGHRVDVTGWVTDAELVRLYETSDVFLHPQIAASGGRDIEGFGIAVADAMAAEMAVIVGSAGGPSDFVLDGVTGLLVDGRSVQQVSDRLCTLAQDSALRVGMGRRAGDFAESNLTWAAHVSRVLTSLVPAE